MTETLRGVGVFLALCGPIYLLPAALLLLAGWVGLLLGIVVMALLVHGVTVTSRPERSA